MTLAPERPDVLPPSTPVPVTEQQPGFSLAAQLLNAHVLCNLIDEHELPQGIKPDDPQLIYYDLSAGRRYLAFQFCRTGPARVLQLVSSTNRLLTAAYRQAREDFTPIDTTVKHSNAQERERVRALVAEWWLKPNFAIQFGTSTNPHHWYAQPPKHGAYAPFDCLVELHAPHPRLEIDSIEITLHRATCNL